MKLDIGCGGQGSGHKGFLGIDIHPLPEGKSPDEYVQLDFLEDDIPWARGSVEEIILLHVIEHVMPAEGEFMVRRALGLLSHGGSLTITTPDLALLCAKYLGDDRGFWEQRHTNVRDDNGLPAGPRVYSGTAPADCLNDAIHQMGREDGAKYPHQWAYDTRSLLDLCHRAGATLVVPIDSSNRFYSAGRSECGVVVGCDY